MSTSSYGRTPVVLLVEDNDDDVEITRLGFAQAKLAVMLHHVANGEDCLAFLRREGRHAAAPAVDFVLLDLNMPRMDGREVLEVINQDPGLRHLPVIVLTSSNAERDVLDCYRLRCSSYLTKPLEFDAFVQIVRSICDYWLATVVLPGHVLRPAPHPSRFALGADAKAASCKGG